MTSPNKPIEFGESTFESFDLSQIAKELMGDETFRRSRRVARTLVRSEPMTVVLTALAGGAEIHEHSALGPILISVVSGAIVVSVDAKNAEMTLSAGSAAVLSPDLVHRVRGEVDSAFLILFGGQK